MLSQGQMAPGTLTCTKEAWFSHSMATNSVSGPSWWSDSATFSPRQAGLTDNFNRTSQTEPDRGQWIFTIATILHLYLRYAQRSSQQASVFYTSVFRRRYVYTSQTNLKIIIHFADLLHLYYYYLRFTITRYKIIPYPFKVQN